MTRPDPLATTNRNGDDRPVSQGITRDPRHVPNWSASDTTSDLGLDGPGNVTRADLRATPGHR